MTAGIIFPKNLVLKSLPLTGMETYSKFSGMDVQSEVLKSLPLTGMETLFYILYLHRLYRFKIITPHGDGNIKKERKIAPPKLTTF
jgi:hypothetical protein